MTEVQEFDFVFSDRILDKYIESQAENILKEKVIGILCAPLFFLRFPVNIQSERLDVTRTEAWQKLGEPISKERLRERFRQNMRDMFSAIADNVRFDKTGMAVLTETTAGGRRNFVTPFLMNHFTSGNDREREFWFDWHRRICLELMNWLEVNYRGVVNFEWGSITLNENGNIIITPSKLPASALA